MKVAKASPERARAIKAQKAFVVRSSEGRLAPPKSQRAISELVTAQFRTVGSHTRR